MRFVCIKWRLAKLSTSWNLNNAQKPEASAECTQQQMQLSPGATATSVPHTGEHR